MPSGDPKSIATIFFASRQTTKEKVSIYRDGKTEDWMLSYLGFKGKNPDAKNLAASKSTNIPIHITLKCRCDAKAIEISLPFTADGLDVKSATISEPNGIRLAKTAL